GATLAEQIPAAVELDLDRPQTILVGLETIGVVAVRLLAMAELVLLGDEVLDPVGDALVGHGADPTPGGGSRPRCCCGRDRGRTPRSSRGGSAGARPVRRCCESRRWWPPRGTAARLRRHGWERPCGGARWEARGAARTIRSRRGSAPARRCRGPWSGRRAARPCRRRCGPCRGRPRESTGGRRSRRRGAGC